MLRVANTYGRLRGGGGSLRVSGHDANGAATRGRVVLTRRWPSADPSTSVPLIFGVDCQGEPHRTRKGQAFGALFQRPIRRGEGQTVAIPRVPDSPYCPVQAVLDWRVVTEIGRGALFCRIRRGDALGSPGRRRAAPGGSASELRWLKASTSRPVESCFIR